MQQIQNPTTMNRERQEIRTLLQCGKNPPEIVRQIVRESCPIRQEALSLALEECWRELEKSFDPRAVYQRDEQVEPTWPYMHDTIQHLLKVARQAQRVNLACLTHTSEENTPVINPKNSQTMPLIINGNPGTINNHEYHNCTIYQTLEAPTQTNTQLQKDIEDIVAIRAEQEDSSLAEPVIDFAKFEEYINLRYYQNNPDYNHVLEMLCSTDYSDRDKAYFALKIYETPNIIKPIMRPATFKAWYQIVCGIFHLNFHEEYTPNKLSMPSEKAKTIDKYIQLHYVRR